MKNIVAIIVLFMPFGFCNAQTTDFVKGSCTYSFVVPDVDMGNSCDSGSSDSKKLDELSKQIEALRAQMNSIQKVTPHKPQAPFNCDCSPNITFSFSFRDCEDVHSQEGGVSGVYSVQPVTSITHMLTMEAVSPKSSRVAAHEKEENDSILVTKTTKPIKVYCDIDEDIAWTVLMKRRRLDVDFNRTWSDYKDGFGNMDEGGDFWLGLDSMHKLTNQAYIQYSMLWITYDEHHIPHTDRLENVHITDEESGYQITYSRITGNSYYADIPPSGTVFVTRDYDPRFSSNGTTTAHSRESSESFMDCAIYSGSGFWFRQEYYYDGSECGGNLVGKNRYGKDHAGIEIKIRPHT